MHERMRGVGRCTFFGIRIAFNHYLAEVEFSKLSFTVTAVARLGASRPARILAAKIRGLWYEKRFPWGKNQKLSNSHQESDSGVIFRHNRPGLPGLLRPLQLHPADD